MRRSLILLPLMLGAAVTAKPVPPHDDKDIIDRLVLDPTLKTFTKLLAKTGLLETLKSEGPFTVFAPNDAAFARVPQSTMDAWKKDKALLRKMLSYHIVAGKLTTKDFKEGSLKTLSGEVLAIKVAGGLTINGRGILTPDIATSNGTIHTVRAILMAPAKTIKSP